MRLASRMDDMGTETAFEAAARAAELEATGRDVVHLEIGEPDFDTPENVRSAAKRALDEGWTHYGPAPGLPILREAIAADATKRKGFEVDPAHVIVTPGAKPIIFYAMLALLEAGDEAIYPDPGFPIYESMARYVGATARPIRLREENAFRLDPDELRSLVTKRTRMIVFNSPQNPTGSVLRREDLEAIAALAIERDIVVLADEIYGRIVYEGKHFSIASLPGMAERTIVLDGFSKTYAMTGWRLGYGIVPDALVAPFSRLIINSVSCTSSHSQIAAAEALNGPQQPVDAMVREFRARRDLVVDGLNAIPGFRCLRPDGAFYVFPNVSGTGQSGEQLADRLLRVGGVSVLAGTAFGASGTNHVRISYATSRDNLTRALERISEVVVSDAGSDGKKPGTDKRTARPPKPARETAVPRARA
jgi:aspartate/methionine/tyrosine aminotransferase